MGILSFDKFTIISILNFFPAFFKKVNDIPHWKKIVGLIFHLSILFVSDKNFAAQEYLRRFCLTKSFVQTLNLDKVFPCKIF